MSHKIRYLVLILVVLGAVVIRDIVFVRHMLPRILIQPAPRAIAHTFVEAITSGDLELAKSLTDGTPDCVANMARTFERYSPKYLGVPVDEIIVPYSFWYTNDPARETIDFTFSDRDNWPATAGVVTLQATYRMFGKRYTCGALFNDPVQPTTK